MPSSVRFHTSSPVEENRNRTAINNQQSTIITNTNVTISERREQEEHQLISKQQKHETLRSKLQNCASTLVKEREKNSHIANIDKLLRQTTQTRNYGKTAQPDTTTRKGCKEKPEHSTHVRKRQHHNTSTHTHLSPSPHHTLPSLVLDQRR